MKRYKSILRLNVLKYAVKIIFNFFRDKYSNRKYTILFKRATFIDFIIWGLLHNFQKNNDDNGLYNRLITLFYSVELGIFNDVGKS